MKRRWYRCWLQKLRVNSFGPYFPFVHFLILLSLDSRKFFSKCELYLNHDYHLNGTIWASHQTLTKHTDNTWLWTSASKYIIQPVLQTCCYLPFWTCSLQGGSLLWILFCATQLVLQWFQGSTGLLLASCLRTSCLKWSIKNK